MVSVAARVGLLVTILSLAVCVVIGAARIRAARSEPHVLAATAFAQWNLGDENGSAVPDDDSTDVTVDLYGNQVTDAVAKYELDSTGDLYELHSPQTEIPRLKSPKS
jgi:hypothetical protein